MDWRYDNSTDSFSLDIGEFISARGILIADITEAIYMVKASRSDTDLAALATLTIGDGITKVAASGTEPDKLTIKFREADFGVGFLETDAPQYYTGAGIKIAGYTKYVEMDLADNRLVIIPDFIHD